MVWKLKIFHLSVFSQIGQENVFSRYSGKKKMHLFFFLQKYFFFPEYRDTLFPGLLCLKQKHGKLSIFWLNPRTNSFGKIPIFQLFEHLFYSLGKLFFFLEYNQTHFPGLVCQNKKVGKFSIFWPKPRTNPFGKIPIFQVFELVFEV